MHKHLIFSENVKQNHLLEKMISIVFNPYYALAFTDESSSLDHSDQYIKCA